MKNLTSASLFFLAAGLLTSVTILSGYQVLFTIAVIYYTYQAIQRRDFHLPPSAYWLLAFSIVALVSTLLNIDIIPKPSKNLGRVKYFLYGVGGIFVFRVWLKEASDKTKKLIAQIFLVSVIVAALYALRIYIFTDQKRARPMTETMRYGYGSSMFLLTMLSAFLNRERLKAWLDSRLLLTAFILGFLGFFFTYTRGALLGFLCGVPFALYFYRKKMAIIGSLVSLIIIGSLAGFYFFGEGTVKKFRLLSTKSFGSDQIRQSQWSAAAHAIKERPILGWGLSNFHTQVERIKEENNLEPKDYQGHAHNLFLEIAAGTGLIGLFLFLGWLINWARECFKAETLVQAMVIPFGVAFVVASMFEVTFDANNASMIFAIYSISAAFYSDSVKHKTT